MVELVQVGSNLGRWVRMVTCEAGRYTGSCV